MFLICFFCPSVISLAVINGLLKEKKTYIKYFERYCMSLVAVNSILFAVNQYILKYPQSTVNLIKLDDGVVAKSLIIATVASVCWGLLYSVCKKNLNISLCTEENKETIKEEQEMKDGESSEE